MLVSRRLPHAAAAVLLGVGVAQAADAVTFLRMLHDVGPAAEANPLVAAMASAGLLVPLLLAKVGLVAVVTLVALIGDRRYPLVAAVVATLAVAAGVVGAWSNVLVLLQPLAG